MSFARKCGDKYGKKLIDTATKTGIDATNIASKRVVQKTAEATGKLIGNKIADKITNLLGNITDKVPGFITKKWIEVHDQSGESYNISKQRRLKTSMLRFHLCDSSDAYIIVKGTITVADLNDDHMDQETSF